MFLCSLDSLSKLFKHRIPPIITSTEWGKGAGNIRKRMEKLHILKELGKIPIIIASGIELRITTPPTVILTIPITIPISEITPAIISGRLADLNHPA